jgi:glucose dehydrogenase
MISLPRPLRGLLAAGVWTTAVGGTWQLLVAGLSLFGAGETGVTEQRLAVSVWMMHLIVWCCIACGRLTVRRADWP